MDLDEFENDINDDEFLAVLDQASSSDRTKNNGPFQPVSANILPALSKSNSTKGTEDLLGSPELDDLPSDAFSSPEPVVASKPARGSNPSGDPRAASKFNRTNSGTFRQTTLFGAQVTESNLNQPESTTSRVYRADLPPEQPTQHALNDEALKTWVYPTNLGAIRDYQFSIVKNSLFNNTLVALPTGLGKTFIAATVMLNFYRWTKDAKIVFVAPTKPLVAQQVDACYNIAGIPRSETTLLTGDIPPALRVDEWANRRVFFMTPQTLLNDLSHGYADPKSITLMVIDEAHRAVGEYAYAKVTKLIRRFSKSFRVLALTATPGSKVETVQEVIDNLGISHCEIRTEDSIDIRQYVHDRNIEEKVLDPSDEMNLVCELFSEALKPLLDKLSAQNIWYGRGPMSITAFGLLQAQKEWFASRGRHANQGVQFMLRAIFSVLTSLAHSIKLLNFHGIKPFYENMVDFRDEQEGKGQKGSKYKRQVIEHPSFQEMMSKISLWLRTDGFIGHPKLTELSDTTLNHFMDQGQNSGTRVIVFSEYRDSAEDIVRALNVHRPLIKASIFVGQADGKRGEGMKQAQQIQAIEKFKKGDFNVLVATSIGEEGLDIGQVDLIVCYDASASPIRMLQRMGRTGRKRAGKIVLLLMRGKEEDQFAKSKDNYAKMQQLICEGSRFNFRFDLSTRIVPRNARPEVDKRHVDIPVENTQDQSLPEPRKRRLPPGKKKPPKKFHMPDGVETGFQKVTDFMKTGGQKQTKKRKDPELTDLVDVPTFESVILSDSELKDLDRSYRDLPFNHSVVEEADMPSMTSHPEFQRTLSATANVKHGKVTKRIVSMLNKFGTRPDRLVRPRRQTDTSNYMEIPVPDFINSDGEADVFERTEQSRTQNPPVSHISSDSESSAPAPARQRKQRVGKTAPKQPKAKKARVVRDRGILSDGEDMGLTRRISKDKWKQKGKAKHSTKANGINSDELGDDCQRDSDMDMTNADSDDGSDLGDFVVSDNAATSSLRQSPCTSPTSLSQITPRESTKEKPFFVPTQFPATQESDDGIPELNDLVESKENRKRNRVVENDSDDDEDGESREPAAKHVARSRRRIVDDSEEDY